MDEPLNHTERGFANYLDMTDNYGAHVRVRESSAMGDFVWVFAKGGGITGNDGSIHLDRDGALRLIAALQRWVDGER